MTNTDEDATTIFVGNISEKVTEELLYELFLQVGPLESVKIPNDSKGGKCSFGFIRFKHKCSPDYAINLLQGTCLFNRNINLQRRNRTGNNQRHKPPQQEQKHHDTYNASPAQKQQELRHIRFEPAPNFDMLLEMGANLVTRDYRGYSDSSGQSRRSNDNQRSYNDSNERGSRGSDNRNRSYQNEHDMRHNSSYGPNDNNRRQTDRGYDDRRGQAGNKSLRDNRSHDKRPYDSNNRNRGRY